MLHCIWLAINFMLIHTLAFNTYSPTSSPFLMQAFCVIHTTYHMLFHNLNHVDQVCGASYAVGYITECSMTVVIHPGSLGTLTALSMTRMISLTQILVVTFVCNLVFPF